MNFLVIDNIKKFKKHSQFKSLKDFNNNIEQWMIDYKGQFTKSELIALKRLVRYSAGVPGISTAKIKTILGAINEKSNGYGVSRATFKRMVVKARRIGLLTVKKMVRFNMSQSSNLYIFNRFNTIEPRQTESEQQEIVAHSQQETVLQQQSKGLSQDEERLSTIEPAYKTHNTKTNKHNTTSQEIDHTYLPSFIDSTFIDAVKPFCNPSDTYKLWQRVLTAYKRSNVSRPLPEMIETVVKAFKETVFMYKQGQIKQSFNGYFYVLLENKLAVEKRRERRDHLHNWLEV